MFGRLVGTSNGCRYELSRWIFLRGLGLVYLIAFVSLWVQVRGLIGTQGILPAQQFLRSVRLVYPPATCLHLVPSIFWLGAGDAALVAACALGALCALFVVVDVAPRPALVILWALYQSLVAVGQDFLSFQWDALLLEVGLLAVLLAPRHVVPGRRPATPATPLAVFLLWWLLFRLTFASGVVKLTWGDPTWRHLRALDFHYYTQPLPTWTAWYMHQLSAWVQQLSVVATYVLEMGFPLLFFGSRRLRIVGFWGVVVMQGLIFATGNYTFFNLLTVTLALLLLDDAIWLRLVPARLKRWHTAPAGSARPGLAATVGSVFGLALLLAGTLKFLGTLGPRRSPSFLLDRLTAWIEPFRSVNGYGLFRVMTTARLEILVQGSNDGVTWRDYEFKYKPGDVRRRPNFVEPHQPRLDWQMWFAALSTFDDTPWFQRFLVRLLEGSPAVLRLLDGDPFAGHPPRYVRALLFDYRFTSSAERRASGAWWKRAPVGAYGPVLSLTPPPGPP